MARLLLLETSTTGGGSFVSLVEHLGAMDRKRWIPSVAFVNPNRLLDPLRAAAVPVHPLSDPMLSTAVPWWVRGGLARAEGAIARALPPAQVPFIAAAHAPARRRLEGLLRDSELLHLNNQVQRDLFGVIAAARADVPCVAHLRSFRGGPFSPAAAAYANRHVAAFVANSCATAEHWVARGLDRAKVRVVPNGVPARTGPKEDARARFGLPEGGPVVVCVANFSPAKGHGVLLEAFAALRAAHPAAMLLLLGEGERRRDLEARARVLGLGGTVRFAGHVPEARRLLGSCDLVVVPSLSEGFGRAAVEAMAEGAPVVATRAGGLPEVVEDGVSGLLVPPGDAAALAAAMARVLVEGKLAEALRAAGPVEASRCFGMARFETAMEEVYASVLPR